MVQLSLRSTTASRGGTRRDEGSNRRRDGDDHRLHNGLEPGKGFARRWAVMQRPERLTGDEQRPAQLLYFTSPSTTADGRCLVFIREDGGNPNLWVLDLAKGGERQLTFNADGTLWSYVYFRGNPHRGLGKASVSLDAVRKQLYFLQGDDLCRLDLETGERHVLTRLPRDQVTAFTHVSADGLRICVPTTDARALEEAAAAGAAGENLVGGKRNEVIRDKPAHNIDERVQAERLSSWLRIYDTTTGAELACERVPQAWITHVQFAPQNPDWILYNHEWPGDCGIRRLWVWDRHTHRRLRTEGDGRSRQDWVCHEMWQADGSGIIYHGKFADGTAFVGRVTPDGREVAEIALPKQFHRYGHFTAGTQRSDLLVSDGYWHPDGEPENGRWGGEWITVIETDWAKRKLTWRPLCRHESLWDCQDSHPHPVFTFDETAVLFTSNAGGGRSVCRVKVR